MKLKKLGKSELLVSPYCLGTMTFGETTQEDDAHRQINECLDAGINFIDTAEMYPTCPIRKEPLLHFWCQQSVYISLQEPSLDVKVSFESRTGHTLFPF